MLRGVRSSGVVAQRSRAPFRSRGPGDLACFQLPSRCQPAAQSALITNNAIRNTRVGHFCLCGLQRLHRMHSSPTLELKQAPSTAAVAGAVRVRAPARRGRLPAYREAPAPVAEDLHLEARGSADLRRFESAIYRTGHTLPISKSFSTSWGSRIRQIVLTATLISFHRRAPAQSSAPSRWLLRQKYFRLSRVPAIAGSD
jgi:hypothetical protein